MLRLASGTLALFALTLAPTVALAQDDLEPPPPDDGMGDAAIDAEVPADPGDGAGTDAIGDEQAVVEERTGTEIARDSTDPYEDPHENYYFLGLFYRHVFVPQFLLNLFLDDSVAASNPGFGAEFTYRKDQFSISGDLWWVGYQADGPFRASGDPDSDVEFIHSDLSVLFMSASFMWATAFNDIVALEYGVDIGVGIVLGSLERTEAYPEDGAGSVNGYAECETEGVPATNSEGRPVGAGSGYCDLGAAGDGEDGEHYHVNARKWSDGGDVPNVVPWLAIPHLALRIKPVHQLQIRIEGGFGIGFFMGASLAYGFD